MRRFLAFVPHFTSLPGRIFGSIQPRTLAHRTGALCGPTHWLAALLSCTVVSANATAQAPGGTLIAAENQLPGTSEWETPARSTNIEGYASATSVNAGCTINFYINTTAAEYTIKYYRIGYYQGLGGRLVHTAGPFNGIQQPPFSLPPDPITGNTQHWMVECAWHSPIPLQVPASWLSGVYLAKLETLAAGGDDAPTSTYHNYILFIVRNDASTSAFVFQCSTNTWQAYNDWGTRSFYNPIGGESFTVSFNRPDMYDEFKHREMDFVRWLEYRAYDVTYITNTDTDADPAMLTRHRMFLSVGHDEYWTEAMRSNLLSALDPIGGGVPVAAGFFSSNTMYWRVAFHDGPLGSRRRMHCQKRLPQNHPESDRFRDNGKPEDKIIGVAYESNRLDSLDYLPWFAQNTWAWPFERTGMTDTTCVPRILGYEFDRVWDGSVMTGPGDPQRNPSILNHIPAGGPAGLVRLSHSPYTDLDGWSGHSQSTFYRRPSGAGVFASGTMGWDRGLYGAFAHDQLRRMTTNILDNMTSGQVGIFKPISSAAMQARYLERWGASSVLGGWLDMEDRQLVGDFLGSGHSTVLFLNGTEGGAHDMIVDFSTQVHPPMAAYFDAGLEVRGYLSAAFKNLAGDFLDVGASQWLSLNGTFGGAHRIVTFATEPPGTVCRDTGSWLNGFLDTTDRAFVGDFKDLGWDQVFCLNSDSSDGQATIGSFKNTQYSSLYLENGTAYGGWKDADDRQLAGDFRNLGHDQVLFINAAPGAGRVMINDYSGAQKVTLYLQQYSSSDILGGWVDAEDEVLAGDFMGLGYDQVLFINRTPVGLDTPMQGRLAIVDYSSGTGVGVVRYYEPHGGSNTLDGWISRAAFGGKGLTGTASDEVMFLGRW